MSLKIRAAAALSKEDREWIAMNVPDLRDFVENLVKRRTRRSV